MNNNLKTMKEVEEFLKEIDWTYLGHGEGYHSDCRIWDKGNYRLFYNETRDLWKLENKSYKEGERVPRFVALQDFPHMKNFCEVNGLENLMKKS